MACSVCGRPSPRIGVCPRSAGMWATLSYGVRFEVFRWPVLAGAFGSSRFDPTVTEVLITSAFWTVSFFARPYASRLPSMLSDARQLCQQFFSGHRPFLLTGDQAGIFLNGLRPVFCCLCCPLGLSSGRNPRIPQSSGAGRSRAQFSTLGREEHRGERTLPPDWGASG